MKKLLILSILFFTFLISCTYEDKTEALVEEKKEFALYINGEISQMVNDRVYLDGNIINLGFIKFDTLGRLGKVSVNVDQYGVNRSFFNYKNYSSNFFNFELLSYNPVNKRIKAQFSGYIYVNPENRNSEAKYINGSFDLPFIKRILPLNGLTNKAKINTESWECTDYFTIKNNPLDYHNLTIHTLMDDEYKILITFNRQTTLVGNYQFNETSSSNKVQIAKYNLNTETYTFYNCTGSLILTERVFNTIRGTYNFTGINPENPSDIIQVTDGTYFLNYPPFE